MGEWSRPISILQLTDICLDLVNGLRKTGLHLCAIFVYGFCFPPAPLQLPGFKPVYIFHVVSVNWVWILAYVLFWRGHCFFYYQCLQQLGADLFNSVMSGRKNPVICYVILVALLSIFLESSYRNSACTKSLDHI